MGVVNTACKHCLCYAQLTRPQVAYQTSGTPSQPENRLHENQAKIIMPMWLLLRLIDLQRNNTDKQIRTYRIKCRLHMLV